MRRCTLAAVRLCQHPGAAAALHLTGPTAFVPVLGVNSARTNQTPRCVRGHFEPRASRAWDTAEKMSRYRSRGGPHLGSPAWLVSLSSHLQNVLCRIKEQKLPDWQGLGEYSALRLHWLFVGCGSLVAHLSFISLVTYLKKAGVDSGRSLIISWLCQGVCVRIYKVRGKRETDLHQSRVVTTLEFLISVR